MNADKTNAGTVQAKSRQIAADAAWKAIEQAQIAEIKAALAGRIAAFEAA